MYTKEQYLKALAARIEGTYIVTKGESVDKWEPIEHSSYYLELHKATKRPNPYLVMIVKDDEKEISVFVSSLFSILTEAGAYEQIDIKVDGIKHYFIIKADTLENENIVIAKK